MSTQIPNINQHWVLLLIMHEITESNLRDAFAGESEAWMRYKAYEEMASSKGYENIARLFRAISFAEKVHGTNHLIRLPEKTGKSIAHSPYGVGTTLKNLEKGIEGEEYEVNEMYPSFLEVAKMQGEEEASTSFKWALEAEKTHVEFYNRAKEELKSKDKLDLGDMQICSVCGYTKEGESPGICPICGADEDKFRSFLKKS